MPKFHPVKTTLLALFIIAGPCRAYCNNNYKDFPLYRMVVTTFFNSYITVDVPDSIFLSFEKRNDGWHVIKNILTKDGTLGPVHDDLYWSVSSKQYRVLSYTKNDGQTDNTPLPGQSDYNTRQHFLGPDNIVTEYRFNITPYYNYPGYALDVINDYGDAKNLPDSVLYAVADACFSHADDLLNANSGLSKKTDMFALKDTGSDLLSARQLATYHKYYYKGYEKLKELLKVNPHYETIVGDVRLKLSDMYVNAFLQMLIYQDYDIADKELPDGLYDDFMISFAKNFLATCDKNAILFTYGDNDTYPLLYVQAKLGYRRDVSVINLSLMMDMRYLNRTRKSIMGAGGMPMSITYNDIKEKGPVLYYYIVPDGDASDNARTTDLKDLVALIKTQRPKDRVPITVKDSGYVLTLNDVRLVHGQDIMKWKLNRSILYSNDIALLDIITTNNWQRPIYFSSQASPTAYLGMDKYMHHEGLAVKLAPYSDSGAAMASSVKAEYTNLMNNYSWKGCDKAVSTEQMDVTAYRLQFEDLASKYIALNKNDSAAMVLDKCIELFPDSNTSYGMYMINIAKDYYITGENAKGNDVAGKILANADSGRYDGKGGWRAVPPDISYLKSLLKQLFSTYGQTEMLKKIKD